MGSNYWIVITGNPVVGKRAKRRDTIMTVMLFPDRTHPGAEVSPLARALAIRQKLDPMWRTAPRNWRPAVAGGSRLGARRVALSSQTESLRRFQSMHRPVTENHSGSGPR